LRGRGSITKITIKDLPKMNFLNKKNILGKVLKK